MTDENQPILGPSQWVTGDWFALPGWLPVAGLGALPVNAFLLAGPEPLLVDTGLAALSDAVLAGIAAQVDLADLRWIWLSHTDPDHLGNLDRLLASAPKARVITNFLGAGKLALLGAGDPDRLHLLAPGDVLEIAGHRLHQIKPPYYDAPETMGFFDQTDRLLFAADAFGALLPAPVASLDQVPRPTLRDGLVAWSSIDAPWLAHQDPQALGAVLHALDALDATHILSGHLPVAHRPRTLIDLVRSSYGRGTTDAVSPETAAQVAARFA